MEYISALYVLAKPTLTYLGIKSSFLIISYTGEWYSGRMYSKYCIGEGLDGYLNHIWNMASPSCTGLLMAHISLLGVFIASIGMTMISWFFYLYNTHIKEDINNTKKIIREINN